MSAIDVLVEEHLLISSVLQCLEKLIAQAEAARRVDKGAAAAMIDFFRSFADRCHHAKEEDRLFVVLETRGLPRHGGPTGVMMEEHEIGRGLLARMEQALPGAADGRQEAVGEFSSAGREYISLLSQHIEKENRVLFPMAGEMLEGPALSDLLADFRRIEQEAGGGRHQKYYDLAARLCEKYQLPAVRRSQIAILCEEFIR